MDDYDQQVPAGKVGEIVMKGPMVFKGYWNLPEDNATTFRGAWHHTGDLGRFDADGFLFYAGRKAEKEFIKAVCQIKAGQALAPQALIDFVGQRIARFKKPQYVEMVKDMPLLEDGSPDRARIKELYGGKQ